ncbi:hypothetical protein DYST_01818 [Dyella terrae]|nr:hypothetical protein DYST_01818 [Dyella terrae]
MRRRGGKPTASDEGLSQAVPMQGKCDNGGAYASPYFFQSSSMAGIAATSASIAQRVLDGM